MPALPERPECSSRSCSYRISQLNVCEGRFFLGMPAPRCPWLMRCSARSFSARFYGVVVPNHDPFIEQSCTRELFDSGWDVIRRLQNDKYLVSSTTTQVVLDHVNAITVAIRNSSPFVCKVSSCVAEEPEVTLQFIVKVDFPADGNAHRKWLSDVSS